MQRDLRVFRKILPLFDEGKDLELRMWSPYVDQINVGDDICFNGLTERRVRDKRRYSDIGAVLQVEPLDRIWPGISPAEFQLKWDDFYRRRNRKNETIIVFELIPLP